MSRPKKNTLAGKRATEKWRNTMLKKYGKEGHHKMMVEIGRKGGQNGRGADYTGGFASNHELAVRAGSIGGQLSRRGKGFQKEWETWKDWIQTNVEAGTSLQEIAEVTRISYGALRVRVKKEGWEYKGEEE